MLECSNDIWTSTSARNAYLSLTTHWVTFNSQSSVMSSFLSKERNSTSISSRKHTFRGQILPCAMIQVNDLTDVNGVDKYMSINVKWWRISYALLICHAYWSFAILLLPSPLSFWVWLFRFHFRGIPLCSLYINQDTAWIYQSKVQAVSISQEEIRTGNGYKISPEAGWAFAMGCSIFVCGIWSAGINSVEQKSVCARIGNTSFINFEHKPTLLKVLCYRSLSPWNLWTTTCRCLKIFLLKHETVDSMASQQEDIQTQLIFT